jgi:hypothetical protein
MWYRSAVTVMCSLAMCACSSAIASSDHDGTDRSLGVLTRAEMNDAESRDAGITNVYQAITRLRPLFLNRVRETSMVRPGQSLLTVYLDDYPLGTVDNLETIPVGMVRSVQYLSASEATIRWGPKQPGGVILLSTRQ